MLGAIYCFRIRFWSSSRKTFSRSSSLGSGFHHLRLGLKHLPPTDFGQHAHDFSDLPAGSAQHLQAVGSRHQQGDAVVPHNADAFWKPIEGLEFESCQVDLLELRAGSGMRLGNSDSSLRSE